VTFSDIPAGASVFLDANTLVYHFVPHPTLQPACQQLLERIGRQELFGFISTHVLSDVAHRVMTMEAVIAFGWPMKGKGIAQRLRRQHVEIPKLNRPRLAVDEVPRFGIQVLSVHHQDVSAATALSQQFELLSGDALLVAVMNHHSLTHLASHDVDFDRVPGVTRYAPA
jgi:predicted nucleic acid-binding protein